VYEKLDLQEIINEINLKFEFLENYKRINFQFDLQVTELHADHFLLRVALSNLLSNAIKYQKKRSEQTPYVNVRSRAEEGFVVIDVIDNGEGIREEYKAKLFNMFYRGTASSSGSGLGLYIAREAIQKQGGTITMNSTWGEGSTFSIRLPIR